jgi:heat-inducible transcriptional repressor
VPTELGLRLFVDGMMQVAQPSAEDRAQIEASLSDGVSGPVESALAAASAALSGLSACAGLIMVPGHERVLKQVAFVPLAARQALVVLVAADGSIENRVIDVPADLPPSALIEAGNYISATLCGMTLPQAQARIRSDIAHQRIAMDRAAARLVESGLAVWSADSSERPVLIVRGQANLLDEEALMDIERVRMLLDDLENRQSVAELLDLAREADSTRIFIGSENRLFALSGSSVIASPYRDRDGKVVGVIGVIGPTRLNYARVVPMVDFTAQSLGKLIG